MLLVLGFFTHLFKHNTWFSFYHKAVCANPYNQEQPFMTDNGDDGGMTLNVPMEEVAPEKPKSTPNHTTGNAAVEPTSKESAPEAGGGLPLFTLFLLGAGLSVLSAIVAGVFLYQFASNTVDESVLQNGRSQVDAIKARVAPEIDQMDKYIDEVKRMVYATYERVGPVTSWTQARDLINYTYMSSVPSRVQQVDNLAGMGMAILLPPAVPLAQVTSLFAQAMYYEPLRDGTRGYTYERVLPDGITQFASELWFDENGVMRASMDPWWEDDTYLDWAYKAETEFNYKVRQPVQPWASSYDGFPYWWMETFEWFQVGNQWHVVWVYKYLERLQQLVVDATQGDSTATNQVFVYEPTNRAIVTTTYFPEANRTANCYGSLKDFDDVGIECIYRPPENSTFPYIRDLFAQVEDRATWPIEGVNVSTVSRKMKVDGRDVFVVTSLIMNKGPIRLFAVWVRDADEALSGMRQDVTRIIAICCVCIAVSAIITILISIFGVLRPLDNLATDMNKLSAFKTEELMAKDRDMSLVREVRRLQGRFTHMAQTLHSFALYVPKDVVKELLAGAGSAVLGMDKRELSVMFIDIADFTTLCEKLDGTRDVLSAVLSEYFKHATITLMRHGSTIDKFIGDAIMAFWGAPLHIDEPCLRAVCAGLELLQLCQKVSAKFSQYDINLKIRIGANTGDCLCGNIGSEERMNYTALGDTVNTASRMEGLNKQFSSRFMVSAPLLEGTGRIENIVYRHLGSIVAKGKTESIEGYEVLAISDKTTALVEVGDTASDTASQTGSLTSANSSAALKSRKSHLSSQHEKYEMNAMYARRSDLLSPDVAVAEVRKATPQLPPRLIAACNRNNNAMREFLKENFTEARDLYIGAQEQLLSVTKSKTRLPPHTEDQVRGFAQDLERKIAFCKRAIESGGTLSTTFVATEK